VVRGYHLYPNGQGIRLSGGCDGLVQPPGAGLATIDWYGTDFCVEALQEAMERFGQPEVFNTDQGVQFTSAAFLDELEGRGVRVSMDSKGRFLDNIFIERLWRSLKYEEVFIKAYGSVAEARRGIGAWLVFYNNERPHQALDYRTPSEVFAQVKACGHVDNARGVAHMPTVSNRSQPYQFNRGQTKKRIQSLS
jgi:hypothetical protein